MRAYTVKELDDLRGTCLSRWLWGSYRGPVGDCVSRPYRAEERDRAVEEMVRTHMLAGHTAQDLIDSEAR